SLYRPAAPFTPLLRQVTSDNDLHTLSLHDALPILKNVLINKIAIIAIIVPNGTCSNTANNAASSPIALTLSMMFAPWKNSRLIRSEEHTSELQSRFELVCRLLLEKKKNQRHAQQCG